MVPLFVNQAAFAKSVHRTLDCTDCHDGFDGDSVPHKKPLTAVDCGSCHEKEAKQYATSIHGMSHAMGASGAATCTSCHGAHEIVPVKQIDSPVFKLNLPRDLRQLPQQQEPDRRVSHHQLPRGRAISRQHPRPGPAADGVDRRAVLQQLPRRARHQAQRRPGLAHQPRQHRQDLRAVPRRHRGGLQPERPRAVAGETRPARPGLLGLPLGARDREARQRALQVPQRPALRPLPRGPARPLPRDLPRQGHGPRPAQRRPPTSPPATTATATTTCSR